MAQPPQPLLPPDGAPSAAAPTYAGAIQRAESHPYSPAGPGQPFPYHAMAHVGHWAAIGHQPPHPAIGAWPMAAGAAGPHWPIHVPAPAPPTARALPTRPTAARPTSTGPLAALMLAVEQSEQEESDGLGAQNAEAGRGAKRARPAATAAAGGAAHAHAYHHGGSSLTLDSHWYPSSASGASSATSSPTSSVGSMHEEDDERYPNGSDRKLPSAAGAPSGAGSVTQPSRRGRRKGSKDGWNAAGAAALASEEDKVGLLNGVHTANLDKYMPAKEKVKRTRTVLAHMSFEEKTERRKERARKYSQELRRRQLESIQELLIEARRLNVFQLLVQESPDLLMVLSPLEAEEGDGSEEEGGLILFANAAAEAVLLGADKAGRAQGGAEELLGTALLSAVNEGDREAVRAALKEVVGNKAAEQRVRCRLARVGGEAKEVELLLREGSQGVVLNGRIVA